MTDVTAHEALRHSKETRDLIMGHIEECAEQRRETRDGIKETQTGIYNLTLEMTSDRVARDERAGIHEERNKKNNRLITLVGLGIAIAALLSPYLQKWLG